MIWYGVIGAAWKARSDPHTRAYGHGLVQCYRVANSSGKNFDTHSIVYIYKSQLNTTVYDKSLPAFLH